MVMHLLFSIFFLLLFFFIFVVAGIFGIFRSLFAGNRQKNSVRKTTVSQEPVRRREKFFKEDEGEYVDYEEIDKDAE